MPGMIAATPTPRHMPQYILICSGAILHSPAIASAATRFIGLKAYADALIIIL